VSGIWSTVDGPAVRPAGRIAHGRQCSGGQLATGSGPLDAVRRRGSSRGHGLAHRRWERTVEVGNRSQPSAGSCGWVGLSRRGDGELLKGAAACGSGAGRRRAGARAGSGVAEEQGGGARSCARAAAQGGAAGGRADGG
jgi:hypothetical protein